MSKCATLAMLNEIYKEAGYDLSINYAELPPPLAAADLKWMRTLLAQQ